MHLYKLQCLYCGQYVTKKFYFETNKFADKCIKCGSGLKLVKEDTIVDYYKGDKPFDDDNKGNQ